MNSPDLPLQLAAAALPAFGRAPARAAKYVSGGLQHRLMQVEVSEGEVYALKLFATRSTSTPAAIAQLELAETVAALALEAGIPAMVALQGKDGRALQKVDGQWFALYPWAEGEILPPTAASPLHCRLMGNNLARLHGLEIRLPQQAPPTPEAFPSGHFRGIDEQARAQNLPWAPRLSAALDALEEINNLAMQAQLQLREGWVTGHLDCDQKNVLWQGHTPLILDWESVKPIHPALEAMGACVSWAGQSAGDPQFESFAAFLHGYLERYPLSPQQLDLAVDAVLGKWVIWLEFNLIRLLDTDVQGSAEEEGALGAGMHALDATLKLKADGGMYREWLNAL